MKLYINFKKPRLLFLIPDNKYLATKGPNSYHNNGIKKTKILKL